MLTPPPHTHTNTHTTPPPHTHTHTHTQTPPPPPPHTHTHTLDSVHLTVFAFNPIVPFQIVLWHRISELNLRTRFMNESFIQWTRSIDSLNRPKITIYLQFGHCFISQGALDRISVSSENDLHLVLLLIRSRGFRKLAAWVIWTIFIILFSYFRAWQHSLLLNGNICKYIPQK